MFIPALSALISCLPLHYEQSNKGKNVPKQKCPLILKSPFNSKNDLAVRYLYNFKRINENERDEITLSQTFVYEIATTIAMKLKEWNHQRALSASGLISAKPQLPLCSLFAVIEYLVVVLIYYLLLLSFPFK